jgi:tetratricopeptide (TPR) repeat protein
MQRWPQFADDSPPADRETRHALTRMLGSALFAASEKHSDILEYLVESTLDRIDVTENMLLAKFFAGHEKQRLKGKPQNIVRVTVTGLRKRIDEYYREEGYGDLVRIDIPAEEAQKGRKRPGGKAYSAAFSYNRTHPADQEYRRALYYLSQCTPGDDALALDRFGFALEAESDFAPAHAGRAEVFLRWAMYHPNHSTTGESLRDAQNAVRETLRCNPNYWKAHTLSGVLHCCLSEWQEGRASFDRALELDPYWTRYGSWHYPAFLAATGQADEALLLLKERTVENPEDFSSLLAYGFFLYASGRFDEATMALSLAFVMSPRNWLVRLVSALLALAQREPATPYMVVMHQLVGEELAPGLTLLCHAADLRLREHPEEWGPSRRLAMDELFSAVYKALEEIADTLPAPARQLVTILRYSRNKHIAPMQMALGYMAVGKQKKALKALVQACREHDPLTAWLHFWPVFGELRLLEEFQKLTPQIRPGD